MKDKLIREYTRYINGKNHLIQDFVITELPENTRKACDIITNILRKGRKKWDIPGINSLYDFHTEEDEDQDVYFYSIMIPIETALKTRMIERWKLFNEDPSKVSEEERSLFEAIVEKKANIHDVSIFYGIETNGQSLSPLNMPGLPIE